MKSGITLKTADGKPLTVLGAIPVTVTVMESRENTVTEFLHIILELSALYLSKNCLKELNILSKSFPLPCHNPESIQALDSTPSQKVAPCVQFKKKKHFYPPSPNPLKISNIYFHNRHFVILNTIMNDDRQSHIYGNVQNHSIFHFEFCHFLGVIVTPFCLIDLIFYFPGKGVHEHPGKYTIIIICFRNKYK